VGNGQGREGIDHPYSEVPTSPFIGVEDKKGRRGVKGRNDDRVRRKGPTF
jgi:hypothetical protein